MSRSSYRLINYAQRPAKNVERKMIVDALGRLDRLTDLRTMRYVGFGSIYFSDFSLFHRRLGLSPMISIERDGQPEQRSRFELNRPFDAVTVEHGDSSQVLPTLEYDVPTVFWLDYDGPVTDAVLNDASTVAFRTAPLSVMLITVQVEPDTIAGASSPSRVEQLIERIGGSWRLPEWVDSDRSLAKWGTARASYDLLTREIRRAVRERFAAAPPGSAGLEGTSDPFGPEAIVWQQLFHFHYADNAKMLTIGGLLHTRGQQARVDACEWPKIGYVSGGDTAFHIDIPQLTTREALHLDRFMPDKLPPAGVHLDGIPPAEVASYARLYRHFPSFVDADL